MGKITGEEGWISLGPWGGKGGGYSTYKPDGPIMQITIHYRNFIHSILFESTRRDGVVIGRSVKMGGTRGGASAKFCIDRSVEQLSSISLAYKDFIGYKISPYPVLSSICFNTNLKKHGPFGSRRGHVVSIPIEGGVITGFHGRCGTMLDAIGIFVAPKVDSFPNSRNIVDSVNSIQDPDSASTQLKVRPPQQRNVGIVIRDEQNVNAIRSNEDERRQELVEAKQMSCKGKEKATYAMGNENERGVENGLISLGPWGGEDGVDWAYKSYAPIMKISLCYGQVIDSILFETISCDGVVIGSSGKIGGNGGYENETICIDSTKEQFLSISLTWKPYSEIMAISSICFSTNLKKYGPFGSSSGASSLSIPVEGGFISGFHGRGGTYLTAIGVFVAPNVNGLHSMKDHYYAASQLKGKIICEEGYISLGPWGGEGGGYSTYKREGPIMQITICYGDFINSIQFESKSLNGVVIGSPVKIGNIGGSESQQFCIDNSVEQLLSISLTYRDYGGISGGVAAISSICFNTNLKKYGPFGSEEGHYVSIDSIPMEGGIIAGFHGRGGSLLDAIGIFVAPKVNSFPNSGKNVDSLNSIQDRDSALTQLKDKNRDEEGWMPYGPWGGNDGVDWAYKAHGPIMQISICYGEAINSILFESKSCDDVLIGSSQKIGGTGGHMTEMFCIDTSEEQLSSISVTYEYFHRKVTIISLCICTNLNKYGPFGSRLGASSRSIPFPIEDEVVLTGFHGRVGTHLFAIGILVAPNVNSLHPIQDPNPGPTQLKEFGSGVDCKLKTVDNIIHSAASSTATTSKDDHHGGAPSPSSEMIRKDLHLVDSAFKNYVTHMEMQISEVRQKLEELQMLGSSERDFDELGQVIAKLKFQIPLISNKDDQHGGALSPTSKMIRSDLILVDTAFAEAKESMYHMNVKINQAHDKFKDLQLPSTERDSEKLRKADSDKLRKDIAKLKVRIRSYHKIRSVNSNLHHKNWDNINGAKDGMMHFFHREPDVAQTGDFDSILMKAFRDLPEPMQDCMLCFFKFPPMATIKRTLMIYLWIGQGYISQLLKTNGYVWDVEVHAGKIFDKLIAKGFIEPLYQNCSLTPDSCRMSHSVRSSLSEKAKLKGFTSNRTLDLDVGFVCGGLEGHSCLINVGEAIINFQPEIFEDMKHNIRSFYLGRWQSSAKHHIELVDTKILHGLTQLNSLTFLSLRGISMITELPTFISELHDLRILDLRACHNLEVIPEEIGSLKSLTHLDMSECYLLEHMPESLAQLSNIQVLKGFLIGDFDNNQSCTLLDLSRLQKLRKLNIYISGKDLLKLQDVKYLERFEGLKKLAISWGGCSLKTRAEDIAEAFGKPTLPPRLEKLDLQRFPMTSLPNNWMMPGRHKELRKLYIRGGHLCDLHEIGEQCTVEILHLKYLSKLNIDWRELRTLFPKLIYLYQVECPKFTNFPCDERGVWMDNEAINTSKPAA